MTTLENATKRERALKRLDSLLVENKAELDLFKKAINEDPVYAFSWCGRQVRAAVFCRQLCRSIEVIREQTQTGVDTCAKHYKETVLRMAKNTPASTSAMSNLVENFEREVAAELSELFDRLQD